ncbi:hypothetical protein NC652_012996 [Populus alba x Populus x berolinensis]|nr:hypothetical protein NC652_012996 [Populus alba x Populus x berolinensis]
MQKLKPQDFFIFIVPSMKLKLSTQSSSTCGHVRVLFKDQPFQQYTVALSKCIKPDLAQIKIKS